MEKRTNREVCTAREVLNFLVEKSELTIERNQLGKFFPKHLNSALRPTQRYLRRMKFLRG